MQGKNVDKKEILSLIYLLSTLDRRFLAESGWL